MIARSSPPSVAAVTVSGTWFEEAPFEFFTRSCATAGCASVAAGIFAAIVVEFITVVGTAVPFTVSAACDSKFVPCTVTVTFAVPAVTTCGDTWLIEGLINASTVMPVPQPVHNSPTANPRAANFA